MIASIVSFDAESNGLHGAAFAIGAVVLNACTGDVLETFAARVADPEPLDPWVAANVVPKLSDLRITHASAREMRDAFWAWLSARKESAIVVVDCGWPVEAGLLSACVADDPSRAFGGPYPLHEVATMLQCAGMDPLASYGEQVLPGQSHRQHHPVYDAHVSALCARMALERLNILSAGGSR